MEDNNEDPVVTDASEIESSFQDITKLEDESSKQILSDLESDGQGSEMINIGDPKMSKNLLKRIRKAERWEELKILKKKLKKEKALAQKLANQKDSNDNQSTGGSCTENNVPREGDECLSDKSHVPREIRKQEAIETFQKACDNNFNIIIDCDWENIHAEGPLKSLCQQVLFCYGINKKHSNPVSLFVTGVGPMARAQLEKSHIDNWVGVTVTSSDYLSLPNFSKDGHPGTKKLVYLTSDSPNTIDSLDSGCSYIIGGIVDRNRYKGVTMAKALEQGIETAKLPIREHLSMTGTHVLTVNHVFEILLNFSKFQSWSQAIDFVIPPRKIKKLIK